MGASPDAMVNCDCHGVVCVEVKCPFKHEDSTVECATTGSSFCFRKVDGVITLRKDHPYYSQVQCQIFVAEASYCDFMV